MLSVQSQLVSVWRGLGQKRQLQVTSNCHSACAAECLDVVPTTLRVIATRRPRYGCRLCESAVVEAPVPVQIVEGGIPTEALITQVLVAKYADHLPLYRQAQIYARQGVQLDRSTLADWVGRAAWYLRPLRDHVHERLRRSERLFADETTAPVHDPGTGRTKTGQLWAYARNDRPWGAMIRRWSPMSTRPIARASGPRRISATSRASCRSMAATEVLQRSAGLNHVRPKPPKLATLMNDAEPDMLAYLSFPREHRAKLHSTNPIERLNGEIKRRTEVVGVSVLAMRPAWLRVIHSRTKPRSRDPSEPSSWNRATNGPSSAPITCPLKQWRRSPTIPSSCCRLSQAHDRLRLRPENAGTGPSYTTTLDKIGLSRVFSDHLHLHASLVGGSPSPLLGSQCRKSVALCKCKTKAVVERQSS